jgi:hypothetical protein
MSLPHGGGLILLLALTTAIGAALGVAYALL